MATELVAEGIISAEIPLLEQIKGHQLPCDTSYSHLQKARCSLSLAGYGRLANERRNAKSLSNGH